MKAPSLRRLLVGALAALLWAPAALTQNPGLPDSKPSEHFVYIDHEFIFTFEMVDGIPVVNIITFAQGEWPLRPPQIRIFNEGGKRARVQEFSMDTGTEPYRTPFFRVLGDSFIGIDLLGDFSAHQQPAQVQFDLGKFRYYFQPMDPLAFETLVQKINSVNFNSPDLREDFRVLEIELTGVRRIIPRRR
ncbi:MAG TPA: hypothetical protein VLV83_07155 [Acidobacteriota bacterium]|nr:hypothetical protein [Acidobacteriota bacterium]